VHPQVTAYFKANPYTEKENNHHDITESDGEDFSPVLPRRKVMYCGLYDINTVL
jgi:hypothetical protein